MNHSIILSKHYPSELTSYLDINKFLISDAMNKDNLRLHRRYVMYSTSTSTSTILLRKACTASREGSVYQG